MNRRWVLPSIVSIALILVGIWITWSIGQDPAGSASHADPGARHPSVDARADVERRPPESLNSAPTEAGNARTHARNVLCEIVDVAGRPIPRAQAVWMANSAVWEADAAWPLRAWDPFLEGASQGESDAEGGLRLEPPAGASEFGSRLCVARPGYAPRVLEFEEGVEAALPVRLELAEREPVRVRVVDEISKSVVGAAVLSVREIAPIGRAPLSADETRDARYLIVWGTTDAQGLTNISRLDGAQLIWAIHGSRVTRVARIEGPGEVELRLADPLRVRGRVIAAEPAAQIAPGRVSFFALTGTAGERVAEVVIGPDGLFGPIELPVDPEVAYSIQAQGAGFVAASAIVDQPPGVSELFVEVKVAGGVRVPVRIVDVAADPIEGAYVFLQWLAGETWEKARAVTDANGLADVGRIPAGAVFVSAKSKGKAEYRAEYPITTDVSPFLEVSLEAAGTIRGRVVHGDEPVRDFLIYSWNGRIDSVRVEPFRGRADGSFTLDHVPFGEVDLFAVGMQLPRGEEARVSIQPNVVAEPIQLELPDAIAVKGTIVDAQNGEPVSGVTVQAWTSARGSTLGQFGVPVKTGSDGSFEFDRFAPGVGSIEIAKTGFATAVHTREGTPGLVTDFGTLSLERTATLEVEVVTTSDFGLFRCELIGATFQASRALGMDGRVTFEGLSSGIWKASVFGPNDRTWTETAALAPASKGRLSIPVNVDRTIRIEFVDERADPRPAPRWLNVQSSKSLPGRRNVGQSVGIHGGNSVELPVPDFDAVVLCVFGEDSSVVGYMHVPSLAQAAQPIRMRLAGERTRLVILDTSEAPVTGATVFLLQRGGGWMGTGRSDDQGVVDLPELPFDVADAVIDTSARGNGSLVSLRLRPAQARITFDPTTSLLLQISDRGDTVAGCRVEVAPANWPTMTLRSASTSATGAVDFERLTEAEYMVSSTSASTWPVSRILKSTASGQAVPFEVRRRGSVALEVTRGGAHVDWSELRIQSVEFEVDVKTWIEAGLVHSSSRDQSSGPNRGPRIDGLPRGEYRWSALATDGEPRSGTFEVPPGKRADVVVALD